MNFLATKGISLQRGRYDCAPSVTTVDGSKIREKQPEGLKYCYQCP